MDTLYPFSDSLTTTITADQSFTYYVRIPSWVTNGTIAIDGGTAGAVSPSNGLHAVDVPAGTTKFTLDLPTDITIGTSSTHAGRTKTRAYLPRYSHRDAESRPHGSIAVHRGPLHYAYDIARSQKQLAQNAEQPLAVDLEFDATAPWQYAIDPDTLVFHGGAPAGGVLPSPVFDAGQPPYTISVSACAIDWALAGDTFAATPPTDPACTGPVTNITLWPFGVSPGFSVGVSALCRRSRPAPVVASLRAREVVCASGPGVSWMLLLVSQGVADWWWRVILTFCFAGNQTSHWRIPHVQLDVSDSGGRMNNQKSEVRGNRYRGLHRSQG